MKRTLWILATFVAIGLGYQASVADNLPCIGETCYDSNRGREWTAIEMVTDGTDCTAAAAVTSPASGVRAYMISCAMGSAETDGFIYGNTKLPPAVNTAGDTTFTLSSELITDGGAGTVHGYIEIQCVAAGASLTTSWTAGANLDIVEIAGDVVQDVLQSTSATVDLSTCVAGDNLFWRLRICDTDATPTNPGCTSSAGFENDFRHIGMRMN